MRGIQGALLIASVVPILAGFLGVWRIFVRWVLKKCNCGFEQTILQVSHAFSYKLWHAQSTVLQRKVLPYALQLYITLTMPILNCVSLKVYISFCLIMQAPKPSFCCSSGYPRWSWTLCPGIPVSEFSEFLLLNRNRFLLFVFILNHN